MNCVKKINLIVVKNTSLVTKMFDFNNFIKIFFILFMFFWIAKLKKQFLLSLIVLILGNDSLKSFVNFLLFIIIIMYVLD